MCYVSSTTAAYRGSSSSISQQQQQQLTELSEAIVKGYKALMHLLNCNRDSPAVDATTSTVSSAPVAIIAAVASATASATTTANAIPYLHVLFYLSWQTHSPEHLGRLSV